MVFIRCDQVLQRARKNFLVLVGSPTDDCHRCGFGSSGSYKLVSNLADGLGAHEYHQGVCAVSRGGPVDGMPAALSRVVPGYECDARGISAMCEWNAGISCSRDSGGN